MLKSVNTLRQKLIEVIMMDIFKYKRRYKQVCRETQIFVTSLSATKRLNGLNIIKVVAGSKVVDYTLSKLC